MKKSDTYKDKGLRVAVQHKNETAGKMTLSEEFTDRLMQRIEQQNGKPVQHRMKFWPWIAAACVAAFLVVLLAPPRKETITEPQIVKVDPKTKALEVKETEPKAVEPQKQNISQVTAEPRQPHKAKRKASVSKRTAKEEQEPLMGQEVGPMNEANTLAVVEEGDIAPFEESRIQFAEQAKSQRERGNRVIQRVSINGIDMSAEISDILANIDQLEQQILEKKPQNKN